MLTYALETFRRHPAVTEILLIAAAEDMERARNLIADGPADVTEKVVLGGAQRRDSVWHGLQEVSAGTDIVLIHDAARPFVSHRVVSACIEAVRAHGAAVVACPVADTLKRADAAGAVADTVARADLWAAQTPQGFRAALGLNAYARAVAENWPVTDDAGVLERAGHRVHLVEGEAMNFKVTGPDDLAMAERLLATGTADVHSTSPRTGFGYDVHRLVPERPLVLGGVTVPFALGLQGHSDADVLAHAIMDALLGAVAQGDIGQQFPDTDPRYRGISSLELLRQVGAIVRQAGYTIGNIDATIVAQAPKLAPHIPEMRARMADALAVSVAQVSVKATTTEGLGFAGEGAGMAAYATACLRPVRPLS